MVGPKAARQKKPKHVQMVELFMDLQAEHKVVDVSSLKYAKFDMQDIMMQIKNDDHVEKLIRFYMLYSDTRTFKDFFEVYGSYYQTMLDVIRDRALRKHLREKTVLKDKGESIGG